MYVVTVPGSAAPPDANPTFKGEVPTEDVHENAGGQAPPDASAPPISAMDQVTGYEGVGFQGEIGEHPGGRGGGVFTKEWGYVDDEDKVYVCACVRACDFV